MDGIGRRQVLRGAVGTGLALVGAGVPATAAAAAPGGAARAAAPGIPEAVPDADGALRRLVEGNRRWRDLHPEHPHEGAEVRTRLVGGQHPFATVLCCVDSRVPPELVFDQGLGDLLTVRTAGQVLDDAVQGSLEFGRAELGIPLVVVLGHTSCGAVAAAVDAAAAGEEPSGRLGFLVDAIAPALPASGTREERIAAGVDENVRRIVAVLRADPDLSGPGSGGVPTVVGARYDLGTGRVDRIV